MIHKLEITADKYCMHLYWFSIHATGIFPGSKLRTYEAYEVISHYVQTQNKQGLGKMRKINTGKILIEF